MHLDRPFTFREVILEDKIFQYMVEEYAQKFLHAPSVSSDESEMGVQNAPSIPQRPFEIHCGCEPWELVGSEDKPDTNALKRYEAEEFSVPLSSISLKNKKKKRAEKPAQHRLDKKTSGNSASTNISGDMPGEYIIRRKKYKNVYRSDTTE